MNIAKNTRDRIKLWAIVHGTSQVVLAEIVGISKQEITHVGNGRYKDGKVLSDTATAMLTTVDWLGKGLGAAPAWFNGKPDKQTLSVVGAAKARVERRNKKPQARTLSSDQTTALVPAPEQRVDPDYAQEAVQDRLAEAARLLGLDPADLGRAVQGVAPAKKTAEQLEAELVEKQRIIDALLRKMANNEPDSVPQPQFSRRISLPQRTPA